jgi:hypothetical protein
VLNKPAAIVAVSMQSLQCLSSELLVGSQKAAPAFTSSADDTLPAANQERWQQQQWLAAAALSAAAQSLQLWPNATPSAQGGSSGEAAAVTAQLAPYLQLLLAPADSPVAAGPTATAGRSRTAGAAAAAAAGGGVSWSDAQLVFGCSLGTNHWHALKKLQQQEHLQAALLVLLVRVSGVLHCSAVRL